MRQLCINYTEQLYVYFYPEVEDPTDGRSQNIETVKKILGTTFLVVFTPIICLFMHQVKPKWSITSAIRHSPG